MLNSGGISASAFSGSSQAQSSVWQILPNDMARLLAAAGQSQITLLLMAIVVASLMLYLWDHFTSFEVSKPRGSINPAKRPDASTHVKAQPLAAHNPVEDVDVYMADGRYNQAEQVLTKALKTNPNNFDTLYKLLQIYVKTDNPGAYRAKLDRISERWRLKNPSQWTHAQDLYERAWPMAFEGHGSEDDDTYEGDPPSDPVQTKLDLAKAYIDIGDHASAAEILNEVLKEGTPAQVQVAEMLLANIKH